jgi:probable phosphoglycerate mutase
LIRARRTAEIVGRDLEVSLTPVDELREFDVGPFEGVSDCGWVGEWRAGQEVPGVESFAKFRARIQRGIARALDLPGPVLIVAHGGVFWALESLTRLPGQSRLPNASLARFEPPSVADGSWLISITH